MTTLITIEQIIKETEAMIIYIMQDSNLTNDEKTSYLNKEIEESMQRAYNLPYGRFHEIEEHIHDLQKQLDTCQKQNKNLQTKINNENAFKESYLSAYREIADMDIDNELKEKILQKF